MPCRRAGLMRLSAAAVRSRSRPGRIGTRDDRQRYWFALSTLIPVIACAAAPNPTTISIPVALASPGDGSFVVRLALNSELGTLSTSAVKGTWSCWAKAGSKREIDADISKVNAQTGAAALDSFRAALVYPAHYDGQQTSVSFAVANGAYRGSDAVSIRLGGRELADRVTGHALDDPAVMVGCWLQLYDSSGQGGFAYQAATSKAAVSGTLDALLRVAAAPYVLLSAAVPND